MPKTSHKLSSVSRFILLSLAAAMAAIAFAGPARAQRLSQAGIDRRADALLARLTLEQKIKLIGGVDSMFTYAMPQIGLPQLKMSDGRASPMRAASASRRRGTRRWRARWASAWARTRGRAEFISCWGPAWISTVRR